MCPPVFHNGFVRCCRWGKVEKFRRSLREIKDISKFNRLDKSLVNEMDKVFSTDIPKLMEKAARPSDR